MLLKKRIANLNWTVVWLLSNVQIAGLLNRYNMTNVELKNILTSIANTLEQGEKIFPYELDRELVQLLSNLDDTSAKLIATVLNMPVEDFKKLVPNIISLLKAAHDLFATDQDKRIINFCRALANRPIVLSMISKFI